VVYFNPDAGQPFQKTENMAGKMVKKKAAKSSIMEMVGGQDVQ